MLARSQDALHQVALQIPRFTRGVERIRCCQARAIRSTGPTRSSWATQGLEVGYPSQDQATQIGEVRGNGRLLLALLKQREPGTDPAQAEQGLGFALKRGSPKGQV